MSQLPAPIRAALGLVATVVQDRRGLSDKVLELPVLAVSTALQVSLRAQQRYAELTVRGDELLTQWQGGAPEEPPAWARFDDEADVTPPSTTPPAPPTTTPTTTPTATPTATTTTPPTSPAKAAKAAKAMAKVAAAAEAARDAETDTDGTNSPIDPAAKRPVKRAAKKVTAPRNGKASAFDRIQDSEPPEQPTD